MSEQDKILVPAEQAAKMLSMGRSTFWKAVKDKLLPEPVKIGGLTRWRVSALRKVDGAAVLARMNEDRSLRLAMPKAAPLAPGVHHLYRHYDGDGRLLYVGISFSALHRLSKHKAIAAWFWSIAKVEITGYATPEEAMLAERIAIRLEKPLHNVVHAIREAA